MKAILVLLILGVVYSFSFKDEPEHGLSTVNISHNLQITSLGYFILGQNLNNDDAFIKKINSFQQNIITPVGDYDLMAIRWDGEHPFEGRVLCASAKNIKLKTSFEEVKFKFSSSECSKKHWGKKGITNKDGQFNPLVFHSCSNINEQLSDADKVKLKECNSRTQSKSFRITLYEGFMPSGTNFNQTNAHASRCYKPDSKTKLKVPLMNLGYIGWPTKVETFNDSNCQRLVSSHNLKFGIEAAAPLTENLISQIKKNANHLYIDHSAGRKIASIKE